MFNDKNDAHLKLFADYLSKYTYILNKFMIESGIYVLLTYIIK